MIVLSSQLFAKLLPRLMSTAISLAAVALCFLLVYYFWGRNADSKKHQRIIRKRFMYVMLVVDILVLTRIWVDGFSHIITVLSLMAAGLVVANKESVMNLIGGLIINWRDLFVEGDFVQIQNFSGYVFSIGIMYFKLYETVSIDQKQATGRTIKIPNSLVITAPVVNFSPDSNLCLYKFLVNCKPEISIAEQLKTVLKTIITIIDKTYKDHPCYKQLYVKAHNRDLSHLINLQPTAMFIASHDDHDVLKICVQFYCFSQDYAQISQQFWLKVY